MVKCLYYEMGCILFDGTVCSWYENVCFLQNYKKGLLFIRSYGILVQYGEKEEFL